MESNEHTPGPWEVDITYKKNGIYCTSVSCCGNGFIRTATAYGVERDEAIANAELIARAPALLEENRKLKEENERLRVLVQSNLDELLQQGTDRAEPPLHVKMPTLKEVLDASMDDSKEYEKGFEAGCTWFREYVNKQPPVWPSEEEITAACTDHYKSPVPDYYGAEYWKACINWLRSRIAPGKNG